jgi:hypothetical protein
MVNFTVSITLSDADFIWLSEYARSEKISTNDLVRSIIREWVAKKQ